MTKYGLEDRIIIVNENKQTKTNKRLLTWAALHVHFLCFLVLLYGLLFKVFFFFVLLVSVLLFSCLVPVCICFLSFSCQSPQRLICILPLFKLLVILIFIPLCFSPCFSVVVFTYHVKLLRFLFPVQVILLPVWIIFLFMWIIQIKYCCEKNPAFPHPSLACLVFNKYKNLKINKSPLLRTPINTYKNITFDILL